MDKIDGPYYFFKLIQRMRQLLPPWMPTVGLEGGRINIVPVDFVVDAIDHIAHTQGGSTASASTSSTRRRTASATCSTSSPRRRMRRRCPCSSTPRCSASSRTSVKKGLMALTPVRRIRNAVMKDLGLPEDILTFVNYPTRFDCRETHGGAEGHRHRVPARWRLRLAAVGLLGAPPRPGPVHRPHAEGPGAGQGGARSPAARRASAWRPRTSSPRPARRPSSSRATRTSSPRRRRRSRPAGGTTVVTYSADIAERGAVRRRWCEAASRSTAASTSWSTTPAARSAARIESSLRPLPRLRAHDAAQLLRRLRADDGPAAAHGRQAARATSSTSARSAC